MPQERSRKNAAVPRARANHRPQAPLACKLARNLAVDLRDTVSYDGAATATGGNVR